MVRVDNIAAFKDDATDGGAWDVEQTRAHDLANELVSTSGAGVSKWCDPNYDAAGNMTSGPDPRSSALAADPNFRQFYFYDAWNRQVKVSRDTNANGVYDAGADANVAVYYYDGRNYRVAKAVPNAANPALWDRTDFYYNESWQVLDERGSSGQAAPTTVATTAKYQYVWDLRYIDSPVLRRDDTSLGSPTWLFYLNDVNFNVTALVRCSDGAVVERYVYDPYGKVTFCDASWNPRTPNQSAYDNEILYCGYRYDTETGDYSVRHRMYHPEIGRWRQRDPVGYRDGPSLYTYCRGLGPSSRDPLGLADNAAWPLGFNPYGSDDVNSQAERLGNAYLARGGQQGFDDQLALETELHRLAAGSGIPRSMNVWITKNTVLKNIPMASLPDSMILPGNNPRRGAVYAMPRWTKDRSEDKSAHCWTTTAYYGKLSYHREHAFTGVEVSTMYYAKITPTNTPAGTGIAYMSAGSFVVGTLNPLAAVLPSFTSTILQYMPESALLGLKAERLGEDKEWWNVDKAKQELGKKILDKWEFAGGKPVPDRKLRTGETMTWAQAQAWCDEYNEHTKSYLAYLFFMGKEPATEDLPYDSFLSPNSRVDQSARDAASRAR